MTMTTAIITSQASEPPTSAAETGSYGEPGQDTTTGGGIVPLWGRRLNGGPRENV
jgi:hypothetical protein